MKFRVKDMDIATGGIKIVLINEHDASSMDLHPGDRAKVKHGRYETTAVVDIGESEKAVPKGQIGIFEEVLDFLHAKHKDTVELMLEEKPRSVQLIKKKMDDRELKYDELYEIVKDITDSKLTDIEITYFVAASYMHGLSHKEVVDLTKAMIDTGDRLKLKHKRVFDKHCIGGVAGNRTTMLVVPIVAAAGIVIPKTSSRAITSPAGTADTVEVLAKVDLPMETVKKVVNKTGACMVWGGAINLAPADDKIIEVEHPVSIDAEGQLIASILAKKGSVSATDVLIDIPVGKGAKIENMRHAAHLSYMFRKIGKKIGMRVRCVISDGSEPIGNGIGPALEARDVMWVLLNDERAPLDLKMKAAEMAGNILQMAGKGNEKTALELIESGAAYKKFIQIIKAQGGKEVKPDNIAIGDVSVDVISKKNGKIKHIDNKAISRIARFAGAPKDKGAGVYLYKHKGDSVRVGEKLFTIYSKSKEKLRYALDVWKELDGVHIS
ncbi:AMP phosphorylase [Candidatus Woesearchaeota archaeon]|nr:AMP phosphorylase [Candidatus Woesearchaeota archaeon]MBW3021713.1 AMP phosphorylase [Candidatus Woesearchaeota archaeon]